MVHVFKEGGYFGETVLLKESKRTATVRAGSYCDLQVLRSELFMEVVDEFPTSAQHIVRTMEAKIAQYTKQNSTGTMEKNDSARIESAPVGSSAPLQAATSVKLTKPRRSSTVGSLGVATIRSKDTSTASPLHSTSMRREYLPK